MELITTNSEAKLIDFLAVIEKTPEDWMNVHVNMCRLSEQMLAKEMLSAKALEDIQKSSRHVAQILMNSQLQECEGKVFVFEDSDVLALFKKNTTDTQKILAKLRQQFTNNGLIEILAISEMTKRMAALVELSETKKITAEVFRRRQTAVEVADTIFEWKVPDMELTRTIQEKRQEHTKGVVLVIEDDVVARGIVALALRDLYDVIQAKDAKTGITAYVDKAPNTVFLDIHLPDHNGREVLNRIRLLDPEAYVVMLSGDSVPENIFLTKEMGAAGFVCKPLQKGHILKYATGCPTLATS